MADASKIIILPRNEFDNWSEPKGNNIFFVKDNIPDASYVVSLYVGDSKQCDLLDITGESNFDPEVENYNIPPEYMILDKLLFYKQVIDEGLDTEDEYYHLLRFDGTKFLDCGIHNNVTVVSWNSLPETGTKDFIYINSLNGNIYIYDGSTYVPIIDMSSYARFSDIPVADGKTIVETVSGTSKIWSGAGADLSGRTITYYQDSETEVTATASPGATIFNDYSVLNNPSTSSNVSIGSCSTVFGNASIVTASNSLSGGNSNKINGGYCCTVFGMSNTASSSLFSAILGNNNVIGRLSATGYTISNNYIIGDNNTIANGQNSAYSAEKSFIIGTDNVVGGTSSHNTLIGRGLIGSLPRTDGQAIILGKYNSAADNGDIIVGDGIDGSNRHTALAINGRLIDMDPNNTGSPLYGSIYGSITDSTVISGMGVCLSTFKDDVLEPQTGQTTVTSGLLPRNSSILEVGTDSKKITQVTFSSLTYKLRNNSLNTITFSSSDIFTKVDYSSIVLIHKDDSLALSDDVISNFSLASSNSGKIYLMNPGLSLSSYSIVEVLLYNDTRHICAIVMGYDDSTT